MRSTKPVSRRTAAVVETSSGPRYMVPAPRRTLATADRWAFAALMLVGSVAASALTSYLVVRGVTERVVASGTVASAPPAPLHAAGAAAGLADSAQTHARPDSAIVIPTPPPVGDQRALVAAPAPAAPAAAPARATAVPRGAPARRAPPRRPPPARSVPTRPAPLPPAPAAAAAAAPSRSDSAPPVGATPLPLVPGAAGTSGAAAGQGGEGGSAGSTVANPPVRAESTVAAPAPSAPAPVPASASTQQTDIAAELRAIRDELAQRKKRIDSLTHSLDSLKDTPTPPR